MAGSVGRHVGNLDRKQTLKRGFELENDKIWHGSMSYRLLLLELPVSQDMWEKTTPDHQRTHGDHNASVNRTE